MTETSSLGTVERRPGVAGALRRFGVRLLYGFGALIVLVAIWQFVASTWPSLFFPPPSRIWDNAIKLFFSGPPESLFLTDAVTVDIASSLSRLLIGFVIGSAAGILFGAAIGRSAIVREVTDPIVEFLRSIPATATLPLFIILLGGDDGMRIAFIAYAVMWFVLINTAAGVGAIHATMLDMSRVFRLSRAKVLFRVIIPAALPKIFAGLRIGATVSLLAAVVSELMLATNGIGYRLVIAQTQFKMADLWAWIILLAVLGFVINTVMEFVELRLLGWDRLARVSG
jgi:ABC-type nitrate/sulfonate/bicarbonate transport system permease component